MGIDRILVVDDDEDILMVLKDNLELDGYDVLTAESGKKALEALETNGADLVVLDLKLPDLDGIQVCRNIRRNSRVPIIMLTARDRLSDKVLGLESGADDYIVKPFDYLELAARIAACLRRSGSPRTNEDLLTVRELTIDPNRRQILKNNEPINCTSTEFNLLHLLARNAGRPLTRAQIRDAVWSDGDLYHDSRAIDVHIQHLRSKIEDAPSNPSYLITIPGTGYMLTNREADSGD